MDFPAIARMLATRGRPSDDELDPRLKEAQDQARQSAAADAANSAALQERVFGAQPQTFDPDILQKLAKLKALQGS